MKATSTAWILISFFLEICFYGVECWLIYSLTHRWEAALLGIWILMDFSKIGTNLNRIAEALEEKDE